MSHSLSKLLILYAQQFEDQQAPQNMTIALREAADTITRLTAEVKRLTEQKIAFIGEIDRLRETQRTVLVEQGESVARLTAEVERLRSLTVVQESLIRKSEAANEKLRAALRECEAELNAYYRMEYPSDHPYSQKKLAQAMASNPAIVALKEKP